jgi:RNA polymerase sigma-70 factor, ECF subfamily
MESDKELVGSVLAGRQEAYADLVRRHERALLASAIQVLGDLPSAQEAAQEAFVVAFEKLGALRNPESFGPWAVRIARRFALRMSRVRRRAGPLTEDIATESPPLNGNLDERIRAVLDQVARLPQRQRQAVLLRYIAGHDLERIAKMTGQAAGTVRTQLSRAIATLRQRLKETGP